MFTKLLALEPTNLKEVRLALSEAIAAARADAEQKLASLQSDPKAAGSVKGSMLTIEALARAMRDIEKLEAAAITTMQKIAKRLQKC
jgi:hypothetical protein